MKKAPLEGEINIVGQDSVLAREKGIYSFLVLSNINFMVSGWEGDDRRTEIYPLIL